MKRELRAIYEAKRCTAAEAVSGIRSGWWVFVGSGCVEPETLVGVLCERANAVSNVEVMHLLTCGRADYVEPRYAGSFRHNALFVGPNVRAAVQSGDADYSPVFLSEVPELIVRGERHKVVHTSKTVTSFTMGTQALYDFVDDNPSIVFYASDYVNDPRVISRNDQVVAVNSALQISLTG